MTSGGNCDPWCEPGPLVGTVTPGGSVTFAGNCDPWWEPGPLVGIVTPWWDM